MPACAQGHEWALGAIADVVDNAYRAARHAVQLDVWFSDAEQGSHEPYLVIRDDGPGLDCDAVRTRFAAGTASKAAMPPPSATSPMAGTSWLGAACRVGCDICLLSKTIAGNRFIALLSRTAIADGSLQQVLVADWDNDSKSSDSDTLNFVHYTPWKSFEAIDHTFDEIGPSGALVAIFSLRRDMEDGQLELDFESDDKDILLSFRSQADDDPRSFSSLRAYLQIFYLESNPFIKPPRLFIRGAIVRETRIAQSLLCARDFEYRPRKTSGSCSYRIGLHPVCFQKLANAVRRPDEASQAPCDKVQAPYAKDYSGDDLHEQSKDNDPVPERGNAVEMHVNGTSRQISVSSCAVDVSSDTTLQKRKPDDPRVLRECGLFIYHHGRLILPYVKLSLLDRMHPCGIPALQTSLQSTQLAFPPLVGVVQADIWLPTANKQSFEKNDAMKRTKHSLDRSLNNYIQQFWTNPTEAALAELSQPVDVWVKCDKCNAWRIVVDPPVPDMSDVHMLPSWDCSQNKGGTSTCGIVDDPIQPVPKNLDRNYGSMRISRSVSVPNSEDQKIIQDYHLPVPLTDHARSFADESGCTTNQQCETEHVTPLDVFNRSILCSQQSVRNYREVDGNLHEPQEHADDDDGDDDDGDGDDGGVVGQHVMQMVDVPHNEADHAEDVSVTFMPELDLNARTPEPHELPLIDALDDRADFALLPSLPVHGARLYGNSATQESTEPESTRLMLQTPPRHELKAVDDVSGEQIGAGDGKARDAHVGESRLKLSDGHHASHSKIAYGTERNAAPENRQSWWESCRHAENLDVGSSQPDASTVSSGDGVVQDQSSSGRMKSTRQLNSAFEADNLRKECATQLNIMNEAEHPPVGDAPETQDAQLRDLSRRREGINGLENVSKWTDTSAEEFSRLRLTSSDSRQFVEGRNDIQANDHALDVGCARGDSAFAVGTLHNDLQSIKVTNCSTSAADMTDTGVVDVSGASVDRKATALPQQAHLTPMEIVRESGDTSVLARQAENAIAGNCPSDKRPETLPALVDGGAGMKDDEVPAVGATSDVDETAGDMRKDDIDAPANSVREGNSKGGSFQNDSASAGKAGSIKLCSKNKLGTSSERREARLPTADLSQSPDVQAPLGHGNGIQGSMLDENAASAAAADAAADADAVATTTTTNSSSCDRFPLDESWKSKYVSLVSALAPEVLAERCLSAENLSIGDAEVVNSDVLQGVEEMKEDYRRELQSANASLRIACLALDQIRRLVRVFLERAIGIVRPEDDDDEPIESHFRGYLRMIDVLESPENT